MQVYILYPNKRWVDEDQIKSWACDNLITYENLHIAPEDIDLDYALEVVEDCGDVTSSIHRREWNPEEDCWNEWSVRVR